MLPRTTSPAPFRFTTLPAFFAALPFAAGIAASAWIYRPPAWLLLAASLAFACALVGAAARARSWLLLALLLPAWFAAGMVSAQIQPRPHSARELQLAEQDPQMRHQLSGIVVALQPTRADSGDVAHLNLRLLTLDGSLLESGSNPQIVRVSIVRPNRVPAPCGAHIQLMAGVHAVPRYYTPGAYNEADWLAQQSIFGEATAHGESLEMLPAATAAPLNVRIDCRLAAAREHALDRMDMMVARMQAWPSRWRWAQLTSEDVSLLAAALLGDRSRLLPEDRTEFQRVGAFHLLVVSGLSVAVLAAALWWLLRRLHFSQWAAALATLALLAAYARATGSGAPVERALLMTAIYMLARQLYRQSPALNSLSVAALVLLAANPASLFGASVQMTLLAVVAIAGIASPLLERSIAPWLRAARRLQEPIDASLPARLAQFRVTLRLWSRALRPLLGRRASAWLPAALARAVLRLGELVFVSFVLEMALAIPMAQNFHRVVLMSVGANFLTVPLLVTLLPLALLTVVLAVVWLPAALAPAAATACLLHLAAGCVHWLALLPRSEWRIPPARPAAVMLALACLLAAIVTAHLRRRAFALASVAAVLAMGCLALWSVPLRVSTQAMELTALDVGQGDSLLLAAPGGPLLLVDAGGPAGPFVRNGAGDFYGEDIVSPYLWSRGIRRLDSVALTHAHSDHMGGMADVLRNFHPRELWVAANPRTAPYLALLDEARRLNISIRTLHAGDGFAFGPVKMDVLSPAPGYSPGDEPSNDDSLVLRAQYGYTSALLEGDAQKSSENTMLASALAQPLLHADLLKVGHHGSMSSTTPGFLDAVQPRWAVISAGRHNLYGHPRPPILDRLAGEHARVYRTDLDGASSFLLDGHTVVPIAP